MTELLLLLAQNPPPAEGGSGKYALIALVLVALAVIGVVYANRGKGPRAIGKLDLDPLARLRAGLAKTRGGFTSSVKSFFLRHIDEGTLDALSDVLLAADMGPETTERLVTDLKQAYKEKKFEKKDQMLEFLKKDLAQKLGGERPKLIEAPKAPTVILVMGVNGTGKTTSVAKITRFLAKSGKKVLLAASDTFRAAAVEQLTRWTEKLNEQFRLEAEEEKKKQEAARAATGAVPLPSAEAPKTAIIEIVKGDQGADPASVAHDAVDKGVAKGFDYVIIDTAGRLHTAKNLMTELEKIARVVKKKVPDAPHEALLVLDATTGQNAIRQAQEFMQAAPVTGIFLAKLDGTAKGGIVVAIRHHLNIPVKFIGLGEGPDDIEPFDADRFAEALFS